MQQNSSLEGQRTQDYSLPSGGFPGVAYERFVQMPVPVVLTVLWVAGMVLLSSCVLVLYMLGTLLAPVVAGA